MISSETSKPQIDNNILSFLIINLLFTWLFWFIAIFSENFRSVFHYLGGAIPFITTIIFLITQTNKTYRKGYWVRVFNRKQISTVFKWIILMVVPVGYFLTGLVDWSLNGNLVDFERLQEMSVQPFTIILFVIFIFIFGPLPEELAWRGYVLDLLQDKHDWKTANLILALYWSIWHLPLFFIPHSYQNNLGFLTTPFWLFISSIIAQSFFIGWVFNHTGRSTLSAILIHFFINLYGELIDFSVMGEVYLAAYWWVLLFLILFFELLRSKRVINNQITTQQ